MSLLTIAIPTWNRNEILATTLQALIPQLSAQCALLIVDNHSTTPVEETVQHLLASSGAHGGRTVRNPANIGSGANILRCFELCDTEWLWVLGDDDQVAPDAVARVLEAIQDHPEAAFLNFSHCRFQRERAFHTKGPTDFLHQLDSFGNVNFISCCLYRVPPLLPHLRLGYHFGIYATAPHTAVLLASMTAETVCWFLPARILTAIELAPEFLLPYRPMLGMTALLDLPLPPETRRLLHQKAFCHFGPMSLLLYLLREFPGPDGDSQVAYYYGQIVHRNYPLLPRWGDRLLGFALLPLARRPALARALHRLWGRFKRTAHGGASGLPDPRTPGGNRERL